MPPPLPQLPLRAATSHPWRWEENRSVLVWEDGTTLGFLDEIEAMSRHTTQGRLPALPCVALILAGCRGKAPSFNPINAHGVPLGMLSAASDVLCKLNAFPPDTLTVAGKAAIIEMVADAQRLATYFVSDAIADWRDEGHLTPVFGVDEPLPRLLLRISDALATITPASIRARLKTGLDDVPQEAELPDLDLITSVRELISQLKEDAELSGIAALARDLLAALTFPRRPDEDAELPEGGFSDLTNRGSPDRLILSELAADPLLLAVRVSLNEALYLRRETPRRSRPRTAAVLVDTSLRLWGLPRPFAWAVALALLAKQEGAAKLTLWCVDGANVCPMRLSSREDLLSALARLDPGDDPVPSLRRFFEAATPHEKSDPPLSEADFFFVTHPDTIAEPGFWREAENWPPLHLALVDHAGRFILEHRSRSNRRELARARLKLDSVLPPSAARTVRSGPREPVILQQHPFPLRISARGRVVASCPAGDDAWCAITEPRQWVHWQSGWPGGDLLSHRLPKGRVVWMDFSPPNTAFALFSQDKGAGTLLRSDNGAVTEFESELPAPLLHAHRFGEALIVVTTTTLSAYDLRDGRRLAMHEDVFHLAPPFQFRGRFFLNRFMWCTLTWNGVVANSPRVLWPDVHNLVLPFDTPHDGAHGLYRDGSLLSFASEPPKLISRIRPSQTRATVEKAFLSADARRLVIHFSGGITVGWKFGDEHSTPLSTWMSESWLSKPRPPGSISFVNITRVGFTTSHQLALELNGKHWYRLHTQNNHLLWQSTLRTEDLQNIIAMERSDLPTDSWRGVAEWRGGARLLLDHHGLLHLMPAALDEPEICLTTGSAAFWSSDGRCGGAPLLCSSQLIGPASASAIEDAVAQFASRALLHPSSDA
jgi:hypothetical protein